MHPLQAIEKYCNEVRRLEVEQPTRGNRNVYCQDVLLIKSFLYSLVHIVQILLCIGSKHGCPSLNAYATHLGHDVATAGRASCVERVDRFVKEEA